MSEYINFVILQFESFVQALQSITVYEDISFFSICLGIYLTSFGILLLKVLLFGDK